MPLRKTVFHVHTDHSDDGNASIRDLIDDARRAGIHCLAVTDHDTIRGAQALAAVGPPDVQVIVGEEISTLEGHLVGLFLHESVEPGQLARRTAELIHRQGGLVVAPHPFNHLFGCSLRRKVYDLLDLIDVVEVCNAQNLLPRANRRAEEFARRFGFPSIAGADMHQRGYLDACYQWMPPFDGPQSFLASLRKATFVRGRHPLSYFVQAAGVVLRDRLGWSQPEGYGRNCLQQRSRGKPAPVFVQAE